MTDREPPVTMDDKVEYRGKIAEQKMKSRRRYSLAELLEGAEPTVVTPELREWMDAPPVGNEVW